MLGVRKMKVELSASSSASLARRESRRRWVCDVDEVEIGFGRIAASSEKSSVEDELAVFRIGGCRHVVSPSTGELVDVSKLRAKTIDELKLKLAIAGCALD